MAIEALTLKQIRDQYQTGYNNLPLQQVQDPQDDTGFFEDFGSAFGAAFELENSVGSFFADETRNTTNDIEEGYDVFNDIQGYEEDAYAFVGVRNSERANAIKRSIDQEKRNKEIIANAGAGGIAASMVASIFDPVDWAIAGLTGGISIVGKAGKTARVLLEATAATVATETALQTTQVTRSAEESLINIASAPIMIGAVKASQVAIKMAGKSGIPKHIDVEEAGEQIIDAMNNKFDPNATPNRLPDNMKFGDAGAMETRYGIFGADEQSKLAREYLGRSAKYDFLDGKEQAVRMTSLGKQMAWTPIGRLVGSISPTSRKYVHAMLENGFVTKGNIEGVAKDVAAETKINRMQGEIITLAEGHGKTVYKKAKDNGEQMSYEDFQKEVGKAMSNNDTHPNKYVQELAQEYRVITDKIADMAKKAKLLPEELSEVTGADSYFTRVYNRQVIRDRYNDFVNLLDGKFMQEAEETLAVAAEKEASLYKMSIPFDESELGGKTGKTVTKDQVKVEIESRVEQRMDEEGLTSDMKDTELRSAKKQIRLDVMDEYYDELLEEFGDVDDYITILDQYGKGFKRSKQPEKKLELLQNTVFDLKTQINKDLVEPDVNEVRNAAIRATQNILSDGMFKATKQSEVPIRNQRLDNSFKKRVISLTDNELEDFLVKDASFILRRNAMSVTPQIQLMQKQLDIGIKNPDLELSEIRKQIESDYEEKIMFTDSTKLVENIMAGKWNKTDAEIKRVLGDKVWIDMKVAVMSPLIDKGIFKTTTEKMGNRNVIKIVGLNEGVTEQMVKEAVDSSPEISKVSSKWNKEFTKDLKSDLDDMEATRQLLLNEQRYAGDPTTMWNSFLRNMRTINFMSMLGNITVSSMTDASRHGMVNNMRGMKGLLKKNLWKNTIKDMEQNEVKKLGIVSELVTNKRAATYADIQEGIHEVGQVEKMLGKFSNQFSKWTGMAAWNEANKQIAVGMTQDIILTAAQKVSKGQSLTPKEIARFAENGLDIDDLTRIGAMYKKYGDKIDGDLLVGNLQKWDDLEISDKFADVLRKQADMIVISPSVGDKPLWASASEIQKTMFQFQSFTFAATNRQLLAGANYNTKQMIAWSGVQLSLGVLVTTLKDLQRGKERDWENEFSTNALEVVDRSGIIPALSYLSKGLAFAGIGTRNRYEEAQAIGNLIGPTFGQTQRLQKTVTDLGDGDWAGVAYNFSKMLPYQNHPLVQVLETYTPLGEIRNN